MCIGTNIFIIPAIILAIIIAIINCCCCFIQQWHFWLVHMVEAKSGQNEKIEPMNIEQSVKVHEQKGRKSTVHPSPAIISFSIN